MAPPRRRTSRLRQEKTFGHRGPCLAKQLQAFLGWLLLPGPVLQEQASGGKQGLSPLRRLRLLRLSLNLSVFPVARFTGAVARHSQRQGRGAPVASQDSWLLHGDVNPADEERWHASERHAGCRAASKGLQG